MESADKKNTKANTPILSIPLIAIIRIYQLTLSAWLGNQCRFYPTCSQYAIEALKVHGAIKGSYLALKRIGRCNKWSEGGEDLVPPRSK